MKPRAFRLSESLLREAQAKADQQDMDLSTYVRSLIADDLGRVIPDNNFNHPNSSSKIRLPADVVEVVRKKAEDKGMAMEDLIHDIIKRSCRR